MKWLRTMVIFDKGGVIASPDWNALHESYVRAIRQIDFPKGSGKLTLKEKKQRPDGQWERNGVSYLKNRFLQHMTEGSEWQPESNVVLSSPREFVELKLFPSGEIHHEPIASKFGGFDFYTTGGDGTKVAIEWETGNISSSHRSINKLAISLSEGIIQAGVLIVPSRRLYEHLTDRIGNIHELSGYLSMWKNLEPRVDKGLLAITVVEHDALTTSEDSTYLPAGKDGRAKEGKAKRST